MNRDWRATAVGPGAAFRNSAGMPSRPGARLCATISAKVGKSSLVHCSSWSCTMG